MREREADAAREQVVSAALSGIPRTKRAALPLVRAMTGKDAVDQDPQNESLSTKQRLIETGEQLFGAFGFERISLKEIAEAAGQRNRSAVQYHFGSKHGFVSAILADRVFRVEAVRAQRFDALKVSTAGEISARDLLKIMWLPDLTMTASDGSHAFCRFSLQYYLKPAVGTHPYYSGDSKTGLARINAEGRQSCLFSVGDLLRSRFGEIGQAVYYRRITTLSMMFLSSVIEYDNARTTSSTKRRRPYDVEPIIDMSIGALSAPGGRRQSQT
jgi:AcrR family transcriptional regulator